MTSRRFLVTVEMTSHHSIAELRFMVPLKMAVLGEVESSIVLAVQRPVGAEKKKRRRQKG